MKSSDLINILHQKYDYLSYDEVKSIMENVFEYLKLELKNGRRIEIRNFGIFVAKKYKEKLSFNPKTQEYKPLEARMVPFYKASSSLRRQINNPRGM